jgi:DnaD/phage-associated family protein
VSAGAAAAPFEGFVAGGAATTLPAQFFVELLPEIEDEAELRMTLYALYAIGRVRGPLRAVRASQLAAERPLLRALARWGGAEAVRPALERAAARGALLACPLEDGDALYLVNTDSGRRSLLRLRAGALAAPGVAVRPAPRDAGPPGVPAQVYEAEIGVLSPSVSEALAAAGERYPEGWIVDALREAARSNVRSWRYAEAILERWGTEGRGDARAEGDPGARGGAGRAGRGPDHGAYEHVVRRS